MIRSNQGTKCSDCLMHEKHLSNALWNKDQHCLVEENKSSYFAKI